MMIVCIYHMVSEKEAFNPTDYEKLMETHNNTERAVLNETWIREVWFLFHAIIALFMRPSDIF